MSHLQCPIHLVGADVVEALAFIPFRETLPIELRGLQQRQGAHHVGSGKGEGVLDAPVYMALGCQMDDAVDMLVLHQLVECLKIADVHLHEPIVGLALNVLQIGQVAGIRKFVQIDNPIVGVLVHKQAHHMGADEACATGDDDSTGGTVICSNCFCTHILSHDVCLMFSIQVLRDSVQ